ncbi:SDR family NAD(P)-dependent oxidoreductase [Amycolatopsis sp. FDAARGOS 1241]|uniref:SDR family NAD(P)-dependent oxidoreductase n=1 Tax=Amycolatopsis sp. FDAARGOS 1241 TaxID=2778070 RepID=UPI001951940A|nr:SDR family NAD(P)-dependent oxidoreductase [Amycolatopsis sp. FDAARGOS 1241]QRP47898.1 SDR family oxidoreductase [Amycolatopsis sp. FDAARGOS 1241]
MDKVAIVTGAGGGLGSVIARELAADGFQVVLADRDEAAAEAAAAAIPGSPVVAPADLTDAEDVRRLVDEVARRFGRLDVVVNSAGIERVHPLESMSEADWDTTMDVNVKGPMLLCRAVVPLWREQRSGSVVNISSRAWLGGSANTAYASSKAALVGLTVSMAVELGPLGVRANAVAPSFVRTLFNRQRTDITDQERMIERYTAFTPLRRLVEPIDVANAVVFLASERARNITGEVLHVCAGAQLPPIP